MYIIKQLKKSFVNLVFLGFAWEFGPTVEKADEMNPKFKMNKVEYHLDFLNVSSSINLNKPIEKIMKDALWEEYEKSLGALRIAMKVDLSSLDISDKQKGKLDTYKDSLSDEKKEKFDEIMKNNPENIKAILNYVEKMDGHKKEFDKSITEKKEKYKDNEVVLAKIIAIETKFNDSIKEYTEKNKDYSKIFDSIITESGENIKDASWKEISSSDIEKKVIFKEMTEIVKDSKIIESIENNLNTIESEKEQNSRYESLKGEYENIQKDEDFKDIIWEKKFNDLTAWDFQAMLKTNPEKVVKLLLSTSEWEAVDISKWWDSYKDKTLKVNFGANKWLDKIIWAWDILNVLDIKEVEINWVKWSRKSDPRPGYYTETWKYLAIHDWYNIKVTDTTKLTWEKEIKEFNESKNKRFEEIRWSEIKSTISNSIEEAIKKDPKSTEIEISYKSEVDTQYVKDLINKNENKYLGLKFEDWKLSLWEWFNVSHLWEALNWYPKVTEKIASYFEKNKSIENSKNIKVNYTEFWDNKIVVENAIKNILNWNDKVDLKIEWDELTIDSSKTDKTVYELLYWGEFNRYTESPQVFAPNSAEAKKLFTLATTKAWVPSEWGSSASMQELLRKESWWKVWILNYTIPKSIDLSEFRSTAIEKSGMKNPFWVKSTASWLGQMTLTNVDKYYPSWRQGIWVPLEEAIWMLKYIKERYWSPDAALSFHKSHNWY